MTFPPHNGYQPVPGHPGYWLLRSENNTTRYLVFDAEGKIITRGNAPGGTPKVKFFRSPAAVAAYLTKIGATP